MVSDKSQIVLGCLLAFVVILSLNFTAAAIEIVSPANYTNASGRIMINFTYTNVTDIRDPLIANTTFYFNNVAVPVNNFTCLVNSCNVTLNTSDIADIVGRNLSVILGNESTLKPADANASFILIDNTKPVVFSGNISNPVTETNYSRNMTINVTVVDTTAGIRAVIFNITNSSGHQNGTFAGVREGTTNQYSFSINTSHFTEGLYNVTIKANDTSLGGNLNDSASVIRFRFDNTKPVVFPQNITAPLFVGNHSQNLKLNVTVFDALSSIRGVMFNITNSTGVQNSTYIATREGATDRYSVIINTSHFPTGLYNVTIFANDTTEGVGGNLNNSAISYEVRFDNVQPVLTLTCTPNPLVQQATLTCSCGVTDALSGVNGSRTSFTTNPSTSNTGVYSTECTSADLAGNAKTELLSYTVTSSGGSGGSSGGGSSSTTTTASATKTTTLAKIAPETPGIVKNLGEKFGMKEISISVNSATTNVKVTVNAYDSRPGSVSTKDGKVLKYLEITQQNIGSMKNAVLMLQIPKIWANSKGLTTSDIAAFKFKNGAWVELPTVFKSEDIGSYYFEATSDSFSFFVIGEKVKVVEQPEAVNNSPEVEETNEEVVDLAPTEEKSSVSFATIAWILLLVIVMAVIVVIVYKKRH
ncbi:MAG: PGF-pre-PGF domain-containing protein [Nanoarchaeota archaeon]|nr:PGF-pre-PGF domain-containing protein [Nanoarchaeota archaeon]